MVRRRGGGVHTFDRISNLTYLMGKEGGEAETNFLCLPLITTTHAIVQTSFCPTRVLLDSQIVRVLSYLFFLFCSRSKIALGVFLYISRAYGWIEPGT